MPESFTPAGQDALLRGLCILVLAIIAAAVMYAAWIGIGNFSRIAV